MEPKSHPSLQAFADPWCHTSGDGHQDASYVAEPSSNPSVATAAVSHGGSKADPVSHPSSLSRVQQSSFLKLLSSSFSSNSQQCFGWES
eukprot:6205778-Pleurochrysis_carterae.AAC.1